MAIKKPKLTDKEWSKLAEKNAQHAARLHVEVGNSAKIAEAFKDIPVRNALEFLFELAEKARKEKKMKKVSVILEAVSLIDRKTGERTELTLESSGSGKKEDTKLTVRRFTPAEVFDTPIEYHEVEEWPEPA